MQKAGGEFFVVLEDDGEEEEELQRLSWRSRPAAWVGWVRHMVLFWEFVGVLLRVLAGDLLSWLAASSKRQSATFVSEENRRNHVFKTKKILWKWCSVRKKNSPHDKHSSTNSPHKQPRRQKPG